MKRSPLLAALVLGLTLAGAPTAHAQSAADVDAARELFREASKLAQEGQWAEAEQRYTRSLKLKRAPVTLYSLGVAQRKTGHLVEALESLRAFLVEPSAPATQPYEEPARQAVAELEKQVARVAIVVEPAGLPELTVTVDGEVVPPAALGLPRLVNPGKHVVAASARGYQPARAEVSSTEASREQVRLALVLAPSAPPPKDGVAPPLEASPRPADPPPPSRALPVALMATGGAAIVAGVAVGMVGVKQAGDAPTKDGPEANAAKTKALAGDIVAGAGIGAVAAGLVVLLVRRPTRTDRPATAVTPWALGPVSGIRVQF